VSDRLYLVVQLHMICVLLALVGSLAIIKHPAWFSGVPARNEIASAR
jgi:hypothetical protein